MITQDRPITIVHMPAARPAPRLRRRSASWWSKLLLLVGSLLTLFVLLEVGFRTFDCLLDGQSFFWDPALASKKKTTLSNPFLLFRGGYIDYHVRAKSPEQVIEPKGRKVLRVACLGGSTTQDTTAYVEEQITYPTELQRLLNESLGPDSDVVVETLNAGYAAHSTMHMLVLLETELLEQKPDVLVVYENINDLLVNYFPGPTTPTYASKFLHPFYLPPEMTVEQSTLLDHSRFYTWTRARLRTVTRDEIHYTDEPIELIHAATYRRNLHTIVAVAKAHGIQVVLGQQALGADQELFEKHFSSKSYNDVIRYPRIDQLSRHFERYNAIVREVADEQGLICVDVHNQLRDHPEHFVDVIHLHASGSRIVGRAFADALRTRGEFQRLIAAKRREAGSEQGLALHLSN